MGICCKCSEEVTSDVAVVCSECKAIYHNSCALFKEVTRKKIQAEKESWVCFNCKASKGKTISPTPSISPTCSNYELKCMIESFRTEMGKKIDDVVKSQSFLSEKYDSVLKKLEEISKLKEKVEKLEKNHLEKEIIINDLSFRLANLEQYSRNATLEIGEIPVKENENLTNIVIKTAQVLNVSLNEDDIQCTHRLNQNPGKTPAIIVQLSSRKKRDDMINSKTKVNLSKIFDDPKQNGRVYVGESLSPISRICYTKPNNGPKLIVFDMFGSNEIPFSFEKQMGIVSQR